VEGGKMRGKERNGVVARWEKGEGREGYEGEG